jgi:hypothetical protein
MKFDNKLILSLVFALILIPIVYATTPIWSEDTSATIIISSDKPSCQITDELSTTGWLELDSNDVYSFSGSSFLDCYRAEVDHGSTGCCSVGFTCDSTESTESARCVPTEDVQLCEDYTPYGKEFCENYGENIAVNEIEGVITETEGFCGSSQPSNTEDGCYNIISDCNCYWDEDANSGAGECYADWNYIKDYCDNSDSEIDGTCKYITTVDDKCDSTGNIETTWIVKFVKSDGTETTDPNLISQIVEINPGCVSGGPVSVRCLSTTLLPFTGATALIIVVLLVIIYYLLAKKKSNNFRLKKKKKK